MVNQLSIGLKNTTNSTVYAYITGRAVQNNNALCLIQADGRTPYYPSSPTTVQSPLAADCTIRLGPPGSTTPITIPQISAARIWFSINTPLVFLLNPGPGLVEPSVTNPTDPNINTLWGFCEFTLNDYQLFANVSCVDFVSIPIAMSLTNGSGQTQVVKGLPKDGLDRVCNGLLAQNSSDGVGWDKLIVKSPSGQTLRALSPNLGQVINPSLFSGYFEPYVDAVWSKLANSPLTVDTQASFGTVQGTVQGGILNFNGVGSFTKPSTHDILTCSTGPFLTNSPGMAALTPRLSAAFNRSTLLTQSFEPSNPGSYYHDRITNHYARIVHEVELEGRGYAFPYDDVAPSGGVDQSGSVFDQNPSLLTITIGGGVGSPTAFDAASRIQAEQFDSNNGVLTQPTTDVDGGDNVGWIANGDWIGFNAVDFHDGMKNFTARVASGAGAGISGLVQLMIDSPSATPIATFSIANTGDWQAWRTVSEPMSITVTGIHSVYLVFASVQPQDFVNINWFTFTGGSGPIPPSGKFKTVAYFVNWVSQDRFPHLIIVAVRFHFFPGRVPSPRTISCDEDFSRVQCLKWYSSSHTTIFCPH